MSALFPSFDAVAHVRRPRRKIHNPIPFVKTDGGKIAEGFTGETRDCTVRSLALAAGITYARAHCICAGRGRKPRSGLSDYQVKKAAETAAQHFNLKMEEIPTERGGNSGTARSLCHGNFGEMSKKYNKGRYIFTSGRHAFAVIDGVLHDSWHVGTRTRVGMILKFSSPESVAPAAPQISQAQINELWARLDALEARRKAAL